MSSLQERAYALLEVGLVLAMNNCAIDREEPGLLKGLEERDPWLRLTVRVAEDESALRLQDSSTLAEDRNQHSGVLIIASVHASDPVR